MLLSVVVVTGCSCGRMYVNFKAKMKYMSLPLMLCYCVISERGSFDEAPEIWPPNLSFDSDRP